MRDLLSQLEATNTRCRIHLTKLLSNRHQVRMEASQGDYPQWGGRGGALFAAFDPWYTCWRVPLESFRFFDAAEKKGLVPHDDARQLSRALVRRGVETAAIYDGRFSSFFRDPRIKAIFEHVDELENLSGTGLGIGTSWADRLMEACPWPLIPEVHLQVLAFHDITVGDIEFFLQSPWLTWIQALDIVCIGPWIDFRPHEIVRTLTALRERDVRSPRTYLEDRSFGQKVSIPLFSHGLQGEVIGFFCDIPNSQKEAVISTLIQFGQTMADAYSALRVRRFTQALHGRLNAEALAREVICVTSPVSKVIALKDGAKSGYELVREHNYWAGYEPIPAANLGTSMTSAGFMLDLPDGASIYVEPLSDVPNFHPDFTRMRLESCLDNCLEARVSTKVNSALSILEVQKLRAELQVYTEEGAVSTAKLRQYFIVSRVEEHWVHGQTKVTNTQFKGFLEAKLGRKVTTGYQVSSFQNDVERLFSGRIAVAKNRNGLSLSWNGVH